MDYLPNASILLKFQVYYWNKWKTGGWREKYSKAQLLLINGLLWKMIGSNADGV